VTAPPTDDVTLRLPAVLADLVGGRRSIVVTPAPRTLAELLDRVEADQPVVVRRIRDETARCDASSTSTSTVTTCATSTASRLRWVPARPSMSCRPWPAAEPGG